MSRIQIQVLSALYGTIPEPDSTGGDEDETPHPFGAVGFPTVAGTSPEGHEEACTTIDRTPTLKKRPTVPRGRRLESLARCCANRSRISHLDTREEKRGLTCGWLVPADGRNPK